MNNLYIYSFMMIYLCLLIIGCKPKAESIELKPIVYEKRGGILDYFNLDSTVNAIHFKSIQNESNINDNNPKLFNYILELTNLINYNFSIVENDSTLITYKKSIFIEDKKLTLLEFQINSMNIDKTFGCEETYYFVVKNNIISSLFIGNYFCYDEGWYEKKKVMDINNNVLRIEKEFYSPMDTDSVKIISFQEFTIDSSGWVVI